MDNKEKGVEPIYGYGARVFYQTEDMEKEELGTVIDSHEDKDGTIWYQLAGLPDKPIKQKYICGRL